MASPINVKKDNDEHTADSLASKLSTLVTTASGDTLLQDHDVEEQKAGTFNFLGLSDEEINNIKELLQAATAIDVDCDFEHCHKPYNPPPVYAKWDELIDYAKGAGWQYKMEEGFDYFTRKSSQAPAGTSV